MRHTFTLPHRYVGLLIAVFLILSGLTGAVISWDHELDDWLNSQLMEARGTGTALSSVEIAKQIEARYPKVLVTYLPIGIEPGESYGFSVSPKRDPATNLLYKPGFNQVFIDPTTGDELGKREWGMVWPITKETFVSFLYKFHYTLHLPEMWGKDRWGIWLLGIIAILWALDSFIGFYLTLPTKRRVFKQTPKKQAVIKPAMVKLESDATADLHITNLSTNVPLPVSKSWWQRWQPAWKVRWASGGAKLNFDLHRAFGLWTWGLLFIIAFTAFSLNLYREVFYPVMTKVSKVTPSPFDLRPRAPKHEPITPTRQFAEVIAKAQDDAKARGWTEPVGSALYNQSFGIYGVQFYHPEDGHGAGGVGHKRLYYDAQDGRYLGDRQPWKGTAADIFLQAQFPIHSGRILGFPGRILISAMGLVVAMLSVTGIVIWWRKRASRHGYSDKKTRKSLLS
ncbi:MAG: PepSY-associated TM helix domain-containing protein [Pseudomonadota bacterium]